MPTEIPINGPLLEELSKQFFWVEQSERSIRKEVLADEVPLAMPYHMVARVNGLAIKIWADEHPPPHFHVTYQGRDASFSIADCSRLPGVNGLERYESAIYNWWADNRSKLIEVWNSSRPTDCPVGPIPVPPPLMKKSFEEEEAEFGDLIAQLEKLTRKPPH